MLKYSIFEDNCMESSIYCDRNSFFLMRFGRRRLDDVTRCHRNSKHYFLALRDYEKDRFIRLQWSSQHYWSVSIRFWWTNLYHGINENVIREKRWSNETKHIRTHHIKISLDIWSLTYPRSEKNQEEVILFKCPVDFWIICGYNCPQYATK